MVYKGKIVLANTRKAYRWSIVVAPLILKLSTKWRWVVRFTLGSLFLWRESPRSPLISRLYGPQRDSESLVVNYVA